MANENTKIFSEAIAEAKAIRETAMANAKLALEEAFTPRIQEMMNNRLASLSEEEEMDEEFKKSNGASPDDQMDEISLEELLAELEGLEESSYSEKDGYVDPGVNDPYMEENEIFEVEDDDTVAEITVDDLKDIIRDVVADLLGGPEEEEIADEEEMAGEEEEAENSEMEDELSLEEILAELDLDETYAYDDVPEDNPDDIEDDKELEEAMSTIAQLRSELNEVNLLNAKLLYVNKLFKSKNLTEAQKVKVINAFDRAETVREAKNVFDTLNESLNTEKAKSQIKESLSFASKASGVSDRQPIMEGNDFVARMQKLAGII